MGNTPCSTLDTCQQCGHVIGSDPEDGVSQLSGLTDSLSMSNEPPTAAEQSILEAEYNNLKRISTTLDLDLARFRASIDALEEKKKCISAHLAAYRLALSPYRRLPNEILGMIFGLCVDKDTYISARMGTTGQSPDTTSTLDIDRCPWVLSQVCRRWRNLAISLPGLWTAIDMNWAEGTRKMPDELVERRLSLMLQRSRDQLLHVSWYEHSCTEKIVSLLCSSTFRWCRATIRTGIDGLSWLAPYSGFFPALSTLRVHFENSSWFTEHQSSTALSVFRDSPALTNLTLSGDSDIVPNLASQFPWNQITQFTSLLGEDDEPFDLMDLDNMWENFHAVLPLMLNVEEVRLQHFLFTRDLMASPEPRALERLHTLRLISPQSLESISDLLDSMTLPSLRTLHIADVPGSETLRLSIDNLLRRSSCNLVDFEISGVKIGDVIEILNLPRLQRVHRLSIGPPCSDDGPSDVSELDAFQEISQGIADVLELNDSSEGVMPYLRVLRLPDAGEDKYSNAALVRMLSSRRKHSTSSSPAVRLEEVTFWDEARFMDWDAIMLDAMRNLIAEGLVICDPLGPVVV